MHQTSFTSLIITYNSANEALNLLADLYLYKPANKVIVIDNASRDKTADMIQKYYPQVQLIKNLTNVGYAKAVNQGFDLCDTKYVLLLNPDIRITSPQLFSDAEACLKQGKQIAATAPLQFKSNTPQGKQINFTWSYLAPNAFRVYLSFLVQRRQVFTKPVRVTFLNAGCLFIRRSAFEQIGKLNEKYFMYGEEPDLFLKIKRHGFKCYLLPNAAVIHYRERSLKSIPKLQYLQIKFQAVWNIADALITGWTNILLDKAAVFKYQHVDGKR